MATRDIIAAGFGGQGIMAMGQLITYSGMLENKFVSWLPSYGPEMRGGSANCSVVVSDEPVGSPVISQATDVIVMNEPSLEKFEEFVAPGGNLFLNSSLIKSFPKRNDINVFSIPVNDLAIELGNAKVANMVMLGAFLQVTNTVKTESVIKAFTKVYGDAKKKLLPINERAIATGQDAIKEAGCVGGICQIMPEKTNAEVTSNYSRQSAANIELSGTDLENIEYLKTIKKYSEEDDEKIFENEVTIVDEALFVEEESIKFCDKAAEMLNGDDAGEIFASLSQQSEEHISYLKGLKENIKSKDNTSFADKVKAKFTKREDYDWGKVDSEKARLALNVFAIAKDIKNQSIAFYNKAKENTKDENARKLYDELEYWENFQLEQVTGQYEIYKDEWWSDQMFSKM
ncbi:MAG: 2-oxoacid:acceptor oxidoreductase family protein [Peptoniphilus lacydonensis]|uniref:2-oxoacid:acceptor oxidoreductase family protein n=1 Tax=Peptoniphilus lacydonensis TaxID=1673725 RepID=UPI0029006614|nr:2-oxoacid:acceptor oxidoreductase family protein [Peptoniphilus lacydonensis]MDU1955427.1 2-oxoacid:acceptor oxidoreductase family protein [Peptoniphilus lacydonensis]MDU5275759.1 2-oxoacid:acceptor oxidoreductase family protein [Peptoniphilus lacydonensis]